jgi:branched-chain amino acid aminotransferase
MEAFSLTRYISLSLSLSLLFIYYLSRYHFREQRLAHSSFFYNTSSLVPFISLHLWRSSPTSAPGEWTTSLTFTPPPPEQTTIQTKPHRATLFHPWRHTITMEASNETEHSYQEAEIIQSPTADVESSRGRKRHRSQTRPEIRAIRAQESSTLRGRSRHRSVSPRPSRTCSPSLLSSPTGFRLTGNNRPRGPRRDHCPSRASSPIREPSLRRRQRTRSRARPVQLDAEQQPLTTEA